MANLFRYVTIFLFVISLVLMSSCLLLPWAKVTLLNYNVKQYDISDVRNITVQSFIPVVSLLALVATIFLRVKGLSLSTISTVHYFLGAIVAVFCLYALKLIDKKDSEFFVMNITSVIDIKPDWGIMLPLAGAVLVILTAFLEGILPSAHYKSRKRKRSEDNN